jgi:inner membrane protein
MHNDALDPQQPPEPADQILRADRGGREDSGRPFWRSGGFEAGKRIVSLIILVLLMLIPLDMVEGVIQERAGRKQAVEVEIGDQWGPSQTIGAPVLVIPYDVTEVETKQDGKQESHVVRHFASFLPTESRLTATASVEKRHKSIYEVLVYNADIALTARFAAPDIARLNIDPAQVKWHEASLALILPGAHALRTIKLKRDGSELPLEAGFLPQHPAGNGLHTDIDLTGGQAFDIDIAMTLNGHDSLSVLPLGGQSEIDITSNWPHPDFTGTPLPVNRRIDANGFTAHWSISHLTTGTPMAWQDGTFRLDPVQISPVGVALVEPGNVHQQTDRIVKYGILVVGLTFGTIFVVGLLKRSRVHLVQYLLIGAALTLFYLLLLSLAEQMPFNLAYLIASLVDIGIVTWYAGRTIRPLLGLLTGVILSCLHAYMFVLLQMENDALLAGTIGLFAILLATMIATRKIDWYAIGEDRLQPAIGH